MRNCQRIAGVAQRSNTSAHTFIHTYVLCFAISALTPPTTASNVRATVRPAAAFAVAFSGASRSDVFRLPRYCLRRFFILKIFTFGFKLFTRALFCLSSFWLRIRSSLALVSSVWQAP
uniref:Uncharacterized protein n=1 Tax=Bactrocera latifrons TaxID=174628 RepID=A0A0K8U886_BACLA